MHFSILYILGNSVNYQISELPHGGRIAGKNSEPAITINSGDENFPPFSLGFIYRISIFSIGMILYLY